MDALSHLARDYRERYNWSAEPDIRKGLSEASAEYIKRNAMAIGDGIAVAVALELLLAHQDVHLDQLSDQAREAFHEAFPNVPIESLSDASQQQLEGMLNAWKGKLFEVDVRDRLNQGEWVGDWHLEPGQTAALAESATQPGWDLSIHNDDGSVADVIQLKATDSVSYIRDTLERYPDIQILATGDVASATDHLHAVSTDTYSVNDYSEQITDAVPIDAGHDVADGFGMMAPASMIALTEGYQVLTGKKTLDDALESSGERLMLTGMAAVAGTVATALTGGLFGALVAIGTRLYLGSKMKESAKPRKGLIRHASPEYKKQQRGSGVTIEGVATRVDESSPREKSKQRENSPKVDYFRRLEDLNAYLGRRYLLGPST